MSLVSAPQEVRLGVEDDGIGFDPSEIPAERYGLAGINERAKLLGGSMILESSPGMVSRYAQLRASPRFISILAVV